MPSSWDFESFDLKHRSAIYLQNVPKWSKLNSIAKFDHLLIVILQDKEIHILLEDQQKINQFARLNNRLEELKEDVKAKKQEIQTLDDAGTDLMMLEDDDEKVPYQIGEVFVEMSQDEVQETLDKTKDTLSEEVTKLDEKAEDIKGQMSDLKTHLYAKFGNAINLEADDE